MIQSYDQAPKKAVKERIYQSHNFANVGFIESLTYANKEICRESGKNYSIKEK